MIDSIVLAGSLLARAIPKEKRKGRKESFTMGHSTQVPQPRQFNLLRDT